MRVRETPASWALVMTLAMVACEDDLLRRPAESDAPRDTGNDGPGGGLDGGFDPADVGGTANDAGAGFEAGVAPEAGIEAEAGVHLDAGSAPDGDVEAGVPTPDAGGDDDGGSDSDPDGGPPVLTVCGGFQGILCPAAEYCDYLLGMCGVTDGPGVCRPQPTACPDINAPVCGCNAQVFGNDCQANAAGFDVSISANCATPARTFRCGYRYCTLGSTYCRRTFPSDPSLPVTYECPAVPASCGAVQDCDCLAEEPCADMCSVLPGGNVMLSCVAD